MKFHSKALFQFENHLPLDRTEGVPTTKPIVYFAVRIPKNLRLVPNPAELRGVERVVADDFLDRGCASRVEKCAAQIEAVLAGIREKVLDPQQWGSFSRMYQAKQAA